MTASPASRAAAAQVRLRRRLLMLLARSPWLRADLADRRLQAVARIGRHRLRRLLEPRDLPLHRAQRIAMANVGVLLGLGHLVAQVADPLAERRIARSRRPGRRPDRAGRRVRCAATATPPDPVAGRSRTAGTADTRGPWRYPKHQETGARPRRQGRGHRALFQEHGKERVKRRCILQRSASAFRPKCNWSAAACAC